MRSRYIFLREFIVIISFKPIQKKKTIYRREKKKQRKDFNSLLFEWHSMYKKAFKSFLIISLKDSKHSVYVRA